MLGLKLIRFDKRVYMDWGMALGTTASSTNNTYFIMHVLSIDMEVLKYQHECHILFNINIYVVL